KPQARLFRVDPVGAEASEAEFGGTEVSSSLSAGGLASILNRELTPFDQRLARILHLEPDAAERVKVQETLSPIARIVPAATVEEAWHLLRKEPLDLLLLDLHLKDGCSLDLLLTLRGFGLEGLPVVMRSDAAMPKRLPSAVRATLSKSRTSSEQLVATVRSLISGPESARAVKEKKASIKPGKPMSVGAKSGAEVE
ncbi:MAG TPA: hypothetical protein VMU54_17635, partial [Planctomycetota bacterium]|nr:hypothetical protein [Planctomycetota bacterium]